MPNPLPAYHATINVPFVVCSTVGVLQCGNRAAAKRSSVATIATSAANDRSTCHTTKTSKNAKREKRPNAHWDIVELRL
ncbi:MAG: hypothetical protein QM811_31865 [Pirellulales bacterium]